MRWHESGEAYTVMLVEVVHITILEYLYRIHLL
jgi:hypothetical protein